MENLWLFMRENWLSNRIFKSYDDIVAHCCDAWRKRESQPWRIMSIGRREWGQWVLISEDAYYSPAHFQILIGRNAVNAYFGLFLFYTCNIGDVLVPRSCSEHN